VGQIAARLLAAWQSISLQLFLFIPFVLRRSCFVWKFEVWSKHSSLSTSRGSNARFGDGLVARLTGASRSYYQAAQPPAADQGTLMRKLDKDDILAALESKRQITSTGRGEVGGMSPLK
jgi:hypothetical protein